LLGQLATADGDDVVIVLQDGNAPQSLGVFIRSERGIWPKAPDYISVLPRQSLKDALGDTEAKLRERTLWGRKPTDSVAYQVLAGTLRGRLRKTSTIGELGLASGALVATD
jgi:hypothetical protein